MFSPDNSKNNDKKVHVCIIVHHLERAIQFELLIDSLKSSNIELTFIHLHPTDGTFGEIIQKKGIPYHWVRYQGKQHLISSILKLTKIFWDLKKESLKKKISFVLHAHLFTSGFIALIAGKLAGVKRRIYTRHYSDYHHVYHPHAVKYDRLINYLATDIVAISPLVRDILIDKENVPPEKIKYIPHGFDLERFIFPDPGSVLALRKKYNPQNQRPVIGVIARWMELKGVQYIIPAFQKLLADYPNALLLLFNTKGDYAAQIQSLLQTLPENSYRTITFEPDVHSIYALMDVYVHCPISPTIEAFGQTYVEALAAGIPSVFTLSGIALEFIKHRENAWVVDYQNSEEIYYGIKNLVELKSFREILPRQGRADVLAKFNIDRFIELSKLLYQG